MRWTIPELKDGKFPDILDERDIILILVVVMAIFFLTGYFYYHCRTWKEYLVFCFIPAGIYFCAVSLLVWCAEAVAALFIRSHNHRQENRRQSYREWGQKQLAILGNVILVPELQAMSPLFERKGSPAPYEPQSLNMSFQMIMEETRKRLEQQYEGHDRHLEKIHLVMPENDMTDHYADMVRNCWNVPIEHVHDVKTAMTLLDPDQAGKAPVMLLSMQLWDEGSESAERHYGEYVCAQLVCPVSFLRSRQFRPDNVYGYAGRVMRTETETLGGDIRNFIRYGIPEDEDITAFLGLNLTQSLQKEMVERFREYDRSIPVRHIEQTLPNMGKLAPLLSLAVALELGRDSQDCQILVNCMDGHADMRVISSKKFEINIP